MTISHPLGVSLSTEIEESGIKAIFYTKKVGSKVSGDEIGFPGHTFKIRGGSDLAGFPHRRGIKGEGLKRVLQEKSSTSGPRRKKTQKKTGGQKIVDLRGVRLKKRVRGEELSEWTRQINLVLADEEKLEEANIKDDEFLRPIAEKIGDIVLRWGFEGIEVSEDDTSMSLGQKIRELGFSESDFKEAKEKIGAEVLKIDNRKEVFNKLQKIKKNNPPLVGVRVAQELIEIYKNAKKEEIAKEDVGDSITNAIREVIQKASTGNLKRKGSFSFTVREG